MWSHWFGTDYKQGHSRFYCCSMGWSGWIQHQPPWILKVLWYCLKWTSLSLCIPSLWLEPSPQFHMSLQAANPGILSPLHRAQTNLIRPNFWVETSKGKRHLKLDYPKDNILSSVTNTRIPKLPCVFLIWGLLLNSPSYSMSLVTLQYIHLFTYFSRSQSLLLAISWYTVVLQFNKTSL